MYKIKYLLTLIFILILINNCNSQNNEKFEVFIEKFANDSIFQVSRVSFPLNYVFVDDENFEVRKVKMPKEKYVKTRLFFNLVGCSEAYTVFYDNFNLKLDDTGERVFQWKGFTGMDTRYYFKRISKKWYLVKIEILGI